MSIWKNTEVRRTALWLLLATAVCSVAADAGAGGGLRGHLVRLHPAALPGTGAHEPGH